MTICRICRKSVANEIPLSIGEMIHKSCLQSLQNDDMEIKSLLSQIEIHLNNLKIDLSKRNGVAYKFISIFSKPKFTAEEIEGQIAALHEKIPLLNNKYLNLNRELSSIYDFLTTYPPDWNERRELVIQRDGEFCGKCGSYRRLHLHHVISLGRGGSNKISNLKFLCEKCHSKKHGGRIFSGEFRESETALSNRIPAIQSAIEQNRRISFGYKKPFQKGFKKRTIVPKELVNIPHQHDDESTLCIMGFCELRKANRNFALKRMRGLKVL